MVSYAKPEVLFEAEAQYVVFRWTIERDAPARPDHPEDEAAHYRGCGDCALHLSEACFLAMLKREDALPDRMIAHTDTSKDEVLSSRKFMVACLNLPQRLRDVLGLCGDALTREQKAARVAQMVQRVHDSPREFVDILAAIQATTSGA